QPSAPPTTSGGHPLARAHPGPAPARPALPLPKRLSSTCGVLLSRRLLSRPRSSITRRVRRAPHPGPNPQLLSISPLSCGRALSCLIGSLGACAAPRRTARGLLAVAGDEPGGHLVHAINARAAEVAEARGDLVHQGGLLDDRAGRAASFPLGV